MPPVGSWVSAFSVMSERITGVAIAALVAAPAGPLAPEVLGACERVLGVDGSAAGAASCELKYSSAKPSALARTDCERRLDLGRRLGRAGARQGLSEGERVRARGQRRSPAVR